MTPTTRPALTPAAPAPVAAPKAPSPAAVAAPELMELGDDDFSPLEAEPELLDADAVEPLPPPPRPVLQNSLDLGGPDVWFNSLVLGFAPLGQLGAAPVRGSPLAGVRPPTES